MMRRAILMVTAGRGAMVSAISRTVAWAAVAGHDPRDDAVAEALGGVHRTPGQDHVAHHAVAAHLVEDAHAASVG